MNRYAIISRALAVLLVLAIWLSALNAQPNIVKAEYFVDTDPGFGLAQDIPLTAAATLDNLSFSADVNSAGAGLHHLFVRVQDANGNWGISNRILFYKAAAMPAAANMVKAEYFFDSEPAGGFGGGTDIPVTSGIVLLNHAFTANTSALGTGIHHLFVRVQDANGNWSISNRTMVYKADGGITIAPLVQAEYFIDTDPGIGLGIPVPVTASAQLTDLLIPVAVHGLPNGTHRFFLRVKDETGKWSITNVDDFEVTDADAAPGLTLTGTTRDHLCSGETILAGYHTQGTFNPGNIFSIELSDASGSFASPVTLGSVAATNSGTISCIVPSGLAAGTGYRMRVVSSNPSVTSPLYIGEFYKGCPNNGPLTLSLIEKTNILCGGNPTGSINVSISGGTPGYTITWSKEGDPLFTANTEDLNGLSGGTYHLLVTDDDGAAEMLSVEITEPALLSVTSTVTQMACKQQGAISLVISGGSGGYMVKWDDGPETPDRTGLSANTYNALITDGNGCTVNGGGTIFSPAQDWQAVSAAPYNGAIANKTTGVLYEEITFSMVYIETNNVSPGGIYPRIQLDYESDGNTNGALDRDYQLMATDADNNFADGKQYQVTLNDLPAGTTWKARAYVQTVDGCTLYSDWVDAPDILELPNLQIFASDIRFSKFRTNPGETIDVFATIHNTSPQDIVNAAVKLTSEQNPAASYTVQYIAVPAGGKTDVQWQVQTPDVPAWVPMRVWVDDGDAISESNEADNNAVRAYINGNYNLPGRIDVTLIPQGTFNTCPGNRIRFTGHAVYNETVIMDGSSVAGATVKVTLQNTGAVYNAYTNDDGYFTITLPSLPAAPDYAISCTVTDYTLSGMAAYQFTVQECPQPCTLPDLISSVWWEPEQIVAGDHAKAKWSVTNTGTAASAASKFALSWTGTGAGSSLIDIDPLQPGETRDGSVDLLFLVSEVVTLSGRANAGEPPVEECSDLNNYATAQLEVMPNLPDIIPVGAPQGKRYLCDKSPVIVTLYNAGGVAAEDFNTIVTIMENGIEVHKETLTVDSIGPKSYLDLAVPYTFVNAGNYTFHVACDVVALPGWPTEKVTELDENNNDSLFANVLQVVACKPDIVVASCIEPLISPVNPTTGQFMTLKAVVRNDGNGPTTGDFKVRFAFGNPALQMQIRTVTKILMPGDTALVIIPDVEVPEAGETLQVTADTENTVDELLEDNNLLSATLCYDLQPMPTCENLVFGSGLRVLQYQSLVPWVAVRNNGALQAQGVVVKVSVAEPGSAIFSEVGTVTHNGILKSCSDCPSIVSLGVSYTFNLTGTYTFRFEVDPDNDYEDECNEGNNVLEATITVISSADMRILSQYINPSKLNPQPGETVSFDITYENKGRSNAGEAMKLKLLVDNAEIGLASVNGLQTNDKATVTFTDAWSSATNGVHIVRAIIDADDEVTEADEDNNKATRATIVGAAANLRIPRFEPDNTVTPNQGVTLYADVLNEGSTGGNAELLISRLLLGGNREELTRIPFAFAAGETIPFTYVWNGNPAVGTLFATIENVSVVEWRTDDNEAMTQVGDFALQTTTTPAQCGSTTGSIQVLPVNGSGRYTYTLVNGDELTPLETEEDGSGYLLNMVPGTYSIRVQDMTNGQQLETTATIDEIADVTDPVVSNCPDNISTTHSTVTWTEPEFTDDCTLTIVRSHAPGSTFPFGTTTVTYTATDPAGNQASCSFTVTVSDPTLIVSISGTEAVTCYGSKTGTLTAHASGGKTPYKYLWSNGKTTATISSLAAGTYSVTVTDADLNTATASHTIRQPEKLTGTIVATKVSCFGDTDGKLQVNASGGTPGYTYSLDGIAYQASNLFENLAPGIYSIRVKDANGCVATLRGTVGEPALLTAGILSAVPTCYGSSTGNISVTIAGGTNPKTYAWTGPDAFTSTAKNLRRLAPGMYTLTATDYKGCTATTSAEITSYNQYFSNAVVTNTTCRAGNDGAISLNPSGGSGSGFTAAWKGPNGFISSAEDITGLMPGTYRLSLTDASTGCLLKESHAVGQPASLPVVSATITPVSVCGGKGAINASGSNGDAPFRYSLNGGALQESGLFTGLAAGSYLVTTTDAKGCIGTRSFTVTDNGSDAWESNNSRTASKSITPGSPVAARIGTATDQDWFRFTTLAGTTEYTLRITHATVAYTMDLYTNTGVLVTPVAEPEAEVKTYSLSGGATYHVRISGAQSLTCYSLMVEQNAAPAMLTAKEADTDVNLRANAYPNPHRGSFTIEVQSPMAGEGHLILYDLQGRAVAERKEYLKAGNNQLRFVNMKVIPYVYRVVMGKANATGKILGIQ